MTRPVGSTAPIPTFASYLGLQPGERSISAWKTEVTGDGKSVTITEGSDGNQAYVDHTYPIVRYEFGGDKVIFKV